MAPDWYKLLRVILVAFMCYNGIPTTYCEDLTPPDIEIAVETNRPNLIKEVEDNSRYKTMEANATLMKLLVNDKKGVSKSEVFDMLHSRDDNEEHIDLPSFPEDDEENFDASLSPDAEAEVLQGGDSTVIKDARRARLRAKGETPAFAAGVMVAVTCSIVLIGYAAIVVYRRIYLKKHGLKHELLRNEENVAETRIEL